MTTLRPFCPFAVLKYPLKLLTIRLRRPTIHPTSTINRTHPVHLHIDSTLTLIGPFVDSGIISLDVGLSKTRYRIHRSFLAQSPELAAKPSLKLWGEKTHDTVTLPELDAVTAHTLVTFLYTGRYETLEWLGAAEKASVAAYKLSTCVYCAAVRYKLHGLAELSQEKITAYGQDLTIFDILGVARENAFPILPEDETWFSSYLEGAIKGAVKDDPELFMKPGFVDQIEGDRKFRQVVMKAIVNTYSGGVGGGDAPPMESTEKPSSPDASLKELESPRPSSADSKKVILAVEDSQGGSVQLEDVEPSIPDSPLHRPSSPLSPKAPESVTDELDLKNRIFHSNLAMRPKVDNLVGANGASKHVRNDSFVETEETTSVEGKQEEKEIASPAPEIASSASEAVNGTVSSTKKNKKKKGKKSGGTVF